MTIGLNYLMVILTAVMTNITMELVMGVRQGMEPEVVDDPPRRVDWLGK